MQFNAEKNTSVNSIALKYIQNVFQYSENFTYDLKCSDSSHTKQCSQMQFNEKLSFELNCSEIHSNIYFYWHLVIQYVSRIKILSTVSKETPTHMNKPHSVHFYFQEIPP